MTAIVDPTARSLRTRRRLRLGSTIILAALLGFALHWLIVRRNALPILVIIKPLSSTLLAGAEAAALFTVARLAWGLLRQPWASPEAALRQAIGQTFGQGIAARLLTSECLIWYYALFSWRRQAPTVGRGKVFTYGTRDGSAGMLLGLAFMIWLEPPAVHLVISIWNRTAAWIFTALGIYGFFWLLGEYRATRLRPVTLDEHTLHIRRGLTLAGGDVDLPRHLIAGAAPFRGHISKRSPSTLLRLGIMAEPNLHLTLAQPTPIANHFGISKVVTHVYLNVDEPQHLLNALVAP